MCLIYLLHIQPVAIIRFSRIHAHNATSHQTESRDEQPQHEQCIEQARRKEGDPQGIEHAGEQDDRSAGDEQTPDEKLRVEAQQPDAKQERYQQQAETRRPKPGQASKRPGTDLDLICQQVTTCDSENEPQQQCSEAGTSVPCSVPAPPSCHALVTLRCTLGGDASAARCDSVEELSRLALRNRTA